MLAGALCPSSCERKPSSTKDCLKHPKATVSGGASSSCVTARNASWPQRETSDVATAKTAAATMSSASDAVRFVADCGSGHTTLFRLLRGPDGHWNGTQRDLEDPERKIVVPDKRNPNSLKIALARDVLTKPTEQLEDAQRVFVDAFCTTLEAMGYDGQASIFIGATGGVRKAVLAENEAGEAARGAFERVSQALKAALGKRVVMQVLSGEDEAAYELSAARAACEAVFRAQGVETVAVASAGGASCQFAHPELPSGGRISVNADVYERVTRIREAAEQGEDELKTAIEDVRAGYRQLLVDERLPTMPLGTWAAISLFADFAELAGFMQTFMTVSELRTRVDAVLHEIAEQKGEHALCKKKWPFPPRKEGEPTQAGRNWPIGMATGLRLRAFLEYFPDESQFYFANKLPSPPSAAVDGIADELLDLDWPIGRAWASQ